MPGTAVVHGRNTEIRNRVDRFLKKLGLEVIILDKKAIQGLTIIENIERYSDVRFAVVLMTGDDMGGLKEDAAMVLKPRARQNVIFELGFFFGRLGRKGKVCVLYEKNVEIFSDYGGVVFVGLKERTWKNKLRTAIKKAGLKIRSK